MKKVYILETEDAGIWAVYSSLKKAKAALKKLAQDTEQDTSEKVQWNSEKTRFVCEFDRGQNAWINQQYLY